MTTILVPTDFSKNARDAADFAAEIVKKCNGRLVLFHAYHVASAETPIMIDISDVLSKQAAERITLEQERLSTLFDIPIDIEYHYGALVPLLEKSCDDLHVSLVVMGTKGADTTLKEYFGSNTARAIKELDVPIIVIPEDHDIDHTKSIIFAWDQHGLSIENKKTMVWISHTLDIQLDVVQVKSNAQSGDEYALETLAQSLHESAQHHIIEGDDVVEDLQDYAIENKGLISVVARKHGFLYNLLNKSVSSRLANNAQSPLLIIKS